MGYEVIQNNLYYYALALLDRGDFDAAFKTADRIDDRGTRRQIAQALVESATEMCGIELLLELRKTFSVSIAEAAEKLLGVFLANGEIDNAVKTANLLGRRLTACDYALIFADKLSRADYESAYKAACLCPVKTLRRSMTTRLRARVLPEVSNIGRVAATYLGRPLNASELEAIIANENVPYKEAVAVASLIGRSLTVDEKIRFIDQAIASGSLELALSIINCLRDGQEKDAQLILLIDEYLRANEPAMALRLIRKLWGAPETTTALDKLMAYCLCHSDWKITCEAIQFLDRPLTQDELAKVITAI